MAFLLLFCCCCFFVFFGGWWWWGGSLFFFFFFSSEKEEEELSHQLHEQESFLRAGISLSKLIQDSWPDMKGGLDR